MARQDGRTGVSRLAVRILFLVGLTALGGVLLTFENRTSLSFLPGPTVTDRLLAERRRILNARRAAIQAEEEARRKQDIAQRATSEVHKSIALHRAGQEGKDIVMIVMKPDDPVSKLAVEVFKNAGVSQQLVEESLRDWTQGVNVLELGRRLQEKGIDIPTVVRQAEDQGVPVRQLLQQSR